MPAMELTGGLYNITGTAFEITLGVETCVASTAFVVSLGPPFVSSLCRSCFYQMEVQGTMDVDMDVDPQMQIGKMNSAMCHMYELYCIDSYLSFTERKKFCIWAEG
jgi:hypothetical protein